MKKFVLALTLVLIGCGSAAPLNSSDATDPKPIGVFSPGATRSEKENFFRVDMPNGDYCYSSYEGALDCYFGSQDTE